jgi:hypothetical protein
MKSLIFLFGFLSLITGQFLYAADGDTLREERLEEIWTSGEQGYWGPLTKGTTLYYKDGRAIMDTWINWVVDKYENYAQFYYTYDEQKRLIEHISTSWDGTGWLNGQRNQTFYNDIGKTERQTVQYWNETDWTNARKVEYIYNIDSTMNNFTRYNWANGDWMNSTKTIFVYDINKRVSEELSSIYSIEWVVDEKRIYERNEMGQATRETVYKYGNDKWNEYIQNDVTYTAEGLVQERIKKVWDNAEWENNSKFYSEYNAFGGEKLRLEHIWINEWVPKKKIEREFDETGRTTFELIQVWGIDQWVNYERTNTQFYTSASDELTPMSINAIITPMPADASAKINYQTYRGAVNSIRLVNILGTDSSLLNDTYQDAGQYELSFDTSFLAPGIYFITISTDGMEKTEKLIITR